VCSRAEVEEERLAKDTADLADGTRKRLDALEAHACREFEALAGTSSDRAQSAAAREAERVGAEVDELPGRLPGTSPTPVQIELVIQLAVRCGDLGACVGTPTR